MLFHVIAKFKLNFDLTKLPGALQGSGQGCMRTKRFLSKVGGPKFIVRFERGNLE